MARNRQISYLILRERLKAFLPVLAALVAFGMLFVWYGNDVGSAKRSTVTGTVVSWGTEQTSWRPPRMQVFVELEDGRRVTAIASNARTPPKSGETIELTKREAPSGLVTYRWTH